MLKKAILHPPFPRRAKTRPFPGFVLTSKKSSTYRWEGAGLGRLRAGRLKYRYASGFFSAAALLNGLFEHPAGHRIVTCGVVGLWARNRFSIAYRAGDQCRAPAHRVVSITVVLLLLSSLVVHAEQSSPHDRGWEYGAYLDAAYGLNVNFPDNHRWRGKQTSPRTNELAPNLGLVYLRKEPKRESRWGMELAAQGGYDTKDLVPNEHPMSGADTLRHLARANVSYLAPVGNGLELTGGLMKGFINYESFYAKDNFNYTRAYLTDYNPNFIFAVGGRYPVTPNIDVGLHILNGFQYLSHPNNLPSYGMELDWRMTRRTTFYQNVYYGPDQPQTGMKYWRLFSDSTVQWRNEDMTVALSYDLGTENAAEEPGAPRQFWMGSALFTQWTLSGPWTVGVRPEFFWDRNGILTQFEQLLLGITSTLSYKRHLGPHLAIVRLEYRFDRSTGSEGGFFKDGEAAPGVPKLVKDQHVIWLGLMWAFDS